MFQTPPLEDQTGTNCLTTTNIYTLLLIGVLKYDKEIDKNLDLPREETFFWSVGDNVAPSNIVFKRIVVL